MLNPPSVATGAPAPPVMAAGAGAAHGGSLESTLARKFQSVTNTMDSIQGLSGWCIDNKKYHSVIVRHWLKCLKKSDGAHRLNLIYVANDVIQNCKRKNAIVYRTEFAEVLPEAFLLVNREGDAKVIKSVDRILSIWEERGVYTGTLITELRGTLNKEDSPPETPVEQKTPVESNAALRSKIVAEFVALVDQLSKYKRSLVEVDLREKQLAAMRVDICSSSALRKLKDKAGGKRFSKDFEEGNTQLQEFVKFFEKQSKGGAPLMEALRNADIFYEMQYKEVKIVANAYQTFANRVSHLKRKLDSLKATLPDLDDSPIPSPSADAPSPTGSESPFHDMDMEIVATRTDPDLDGAAMDDELEPPAPSPLSSVAVSPPHSPPLSPPLSATLSPPQSPPVSPPLSPPQSPPLSPPESHEALGGNDNREVEDMELSEDEDGAGGIIVEQQMEQPSRPEESRPAGAEKKPSPGSAAAAEPAATQATPPAAPPAAAAKTVDLGKIGSILNSLSSAMKNTGTRTGSPPAAASPATPALPVLSPDPTSLVNLLSKVDVSPSDLLSALSKVQSHSSLGSGASVLTNPTANVSSAASNTDKSPPVSTSAPAATSQSPPPSSVAPVPALNNSPGKFSSENFKPVSLISNQTFSQIQALIKNTEAPPKTSNQAPAHVEVLSRDSQALPQNFSPASAQVQALTRDSQAPPQAPNPASALVQALHRDMELSDTALSSQSLESKIHNFLQGNPAFSAFDLGFPANPEEGGRFSPATGTDTQEGTPVRDEGGGTPTQDEMMDKPAAAPFPSNANQSSTGDSFKMTPAAYPNSTQNNMSSSQQQQPQNGQAYLPHSHGTQGVPEHRIPPPAAQYQQFSAPSGGFAPGEAAPGLKTDDGFQRFNEMGWYGASYPQGNSQQARGFNAPVPAGTAENPMSGLYQYHPEPTRDAQQFVPQQGALPSSSFFGINLPPVPKLPPPPRVFDIPPPVPSNTMIPQEQRAVNSAGEQPGARTDNAIGGMIVHDHQHKSTYHSEDPPFNPDHSRPRPPQDLHPPEDDLGYHDESFGHDSIHFQEDSYENPDDQYFRSDGAQRPFPRGRGRGRGMNPQHRSPEDSYFPHEYQQQGPPPQQFIPRRPLPPQQRPHLGPRHPGERPQRMPPRPAHPHAPRTRGAPRGPFPPRFQGPNPMFRGKRPGPMGRGNPGPMFPPKRPFPPPRY